MRKDHKRDFKTRPKQLKIPLWPLLIFLLLFLYLNRNNIKEFFPGMGKADVANAALREDMEIRHPITKLYYKTYKLDGAREFADEFWKKCEDNLNDKVRATRCADLVKNLIDREGSYPIIAKAITNHYCMERSFAPFCNIVYEYWKVDTDYSIKILERSCKALKSKDACLLGQKVMD